MCYAMAGNFGISAAGYVPHGGKNQRKTYGNPAARNGRIRYKYVP